MFDIGWQELFIAALVALIVVGPKDLPKVLRTFGIWVAKAKAMAREFQGHIDDMVRDADLDEVKSKLDDLRSGDFNALIENTIDPDNEIKESLEFGGEEFDDLSALEVGGEDANETPAKADDTEPGDVDGTEPGDDDDAEPGDDDTAGRAGEGADAGSAAGRGP